MDLNEKMTEPRTDQENLPPLSYAEDDAAFAVLIQRHRPPLLERWRVVFSVNGRSRGRFAGCLHERPRRPPRRFCGEAKLSTWLYTIALNRVRNHIRRRGNRQMVFLDAGSEEIANSRELPEKRSPPWMKLWRRRGIRESPVRRGRLSRKLSIHFYSALLPTLPVKRGRPATRKTAGNNQSLPPRARKTVYTRFVPPSQEVALANSEHGSCFHDAL